MSEPTPSEKGRILVVDDEELNRELLCAMIEIIGHTSESASSGTEALARVSPATDLVLLDVMMPDIDGVEVLRRIKADPALGHVPVVMVSALTEIPTIVKCVEIGADDYLPKPFNPVLLKARVNSCLERKRQHDREAALFRQVDANYRRLKELEKLRDSLIHMVVHDLRTPLTSIMSGLQTIEMLGPLNEHQREFVTMAVNGGATLVGMVNDMLDISRMEEGLLKLDRHGRDPAALAEEAVAQVAHLAAASGVTLENEVPTELPPVRVDAEKIRRTLVNLLGNAVAFTSGGGRVHLTASYSPEEGHRFVVTDTGQGIPHDQFERIFEKFGQVEGGKSRQRFSTGLGLTFCKMVVEGHGGRIWVESELGQGSTFTFVIPPSR